MNTVLRALLTLVLSVLLVGFGLCGAYGAIGGLIIGASGRGAESGILIVPGLIGLGIAWLLWTLIRGLWRKRPPTPPAE